MWRRIGLALALYASIATNMAAMAASSTDAVARVPKLIGEPWAIAGDPDLGKLTDPKQQPVDFGIWQAQDGTWQLWSCVRHTKCGGKTRLFHRWEGKRLTDPDWKPMGIVMQADPKFGETPGGLQAPYVLRLQYPLRAASDPPRDMYGLIYGDWVNICFAGSRDGKVFERITCNPYFPYTADGVRRPVGHGGMFDEGPEANARDPMLLRIGQTWHCYYTAHPSRVGAVYCRTSSDLVNWSSSKIVARGGRAGSNAYSSECPFVLLVDGWYYLFRTQRYGKEAKTSVYCSKNPMDFGVDSDEFFVAEMPVAAPELIHHDGKWYLACLLPSLKGIQIYRLEWKSDEKSTRPTKTSP